MQALLPGYKAAMEAYMAAVHHLSNRLLLLIAIALQLPTDFFLQFYDKPMMYLRPLHYSSQVSLPDEVTTLLPSTHQGTNLQSDPMRSCSCLRTA